jgi:predicted O-methyltransferase YrrM
MDSSRLAQIDSYIEGLFGSDDPALLQNIADARAAGLPDIQVSPNQGRLLYLLAKMSGARRILEIGTLGGYSTTWLARALPAVHPRLESIILPSYKDKIDGMAISIVK